MTCPGLSGYSAPYLLYFCIRVKLEEGRLEGLAGKAPEGDPDKGRDQQRGQRERQRGGQPLPRGQREAFVLVHLEGYTVRETAEITGRAAGTIKSHLHRALKALRKELADLAPEGRGESK